MEFSRPAVGIFCLVGMAISSACMPSAYAFSEYTHEWATRNAMSYMRTRANFFPETRAWTRELGNDEDYMEESLVRAVVDADYRLDAWLESVFHKPFAGARNSVGLVNLFTTMFHHLNVNAKGRYWEYDGYAYKHSTGSGNDAYLDLPTVVVKGGLSVALGGTDARHPVHGIPLGVYRDGFRGTDADWRRMYFDGASAADAYFPPANVPAQRAFALMLASDRARLTEAESWNESFPLVVGLTSSVSLARHYWRGEIADLPKGFDLLGVTIHMMQDVAMPHHVEGTADQCHPELEALIDDLACGIEGADKKQYYDGSYGGSPEAGRYGHCDRIYDPVMVERVFKEHPSLDPRRPMSVSDRIKALAFISSRWQWGVPEESVDFIGSILPNGKMYTGDRCSDFMAIPAIRDAAKYQYNLAVAATVSIFESAAHEYEKLHPRPNPALKLVFRLFDFANFAEKK